MQIQTKHIAIAITTLIMLAPVLLHAQGGPGGGDLDGDPGTPIDGGLTLLAGAAVAYGVKKLKGKKQVGK